MSVSARGVVRGIHFADVPPGQAKYVTCTRGAVLDVIVDIRVGSPTFGRWEAVRLDDVDRRAVYIGEGLGHGFCALDRRRDARPTSAPTAYNPAGEHGVHPLDPELGIAWPVERAAAVRPRTRAAPDAGARPGQQGLLPDYATLPRVHATHCVHAVVIGAATASVLVMDRRIFGLETEYGVTCTYRGQRRLSPGRGGPLPVPPGRVLGTVQQRLPAQRRPALPRRRLPPRVRDARVRLGHRPGRARPGRRADPRGPAGRRREAAARRGHRRRDLPVQEQHRLGRQLVRLPRELPGLPARRVRPAGRRADPVPGHPPADLRRRQGAADPARRGLLPVPAGRAHLGGRLQGHHPSAARSSTPATSRTPTPSATGGCTSSSATPT